MRKTFAVAMGSLLALVGLAGTANASATIDLIWIDISTLDTNGLVICLRATRRDCPQLGTTLGSVAVTDTITLGLIVTAGPAGLVGAGVSVDYSNLLPSLTVTGFQRFDTTSPSALLPAGLGEPSDIPPFIENFSALALVPGALGIGLLAGQTAYLGTVSFHRNQLLTGTFEIEGGAFGPSRTDGVEDLAGQDITSATTFNSAFVVDPTPTATPTASPTPTAAPTGNPTPSATPTPTPTATPTASPGSDSDGDGVADELDNCSEAANDQQDDTDGDDCGNACDADYNNDGIVGHPDVFEFSAAFGTGDEEKCHSNGGIPGCIVGLPDFGFLIAVYGSTPGPSGTTTGTTACP